jgi:acyl carrier protein
MAMPNATAQNIEEWLMRRIAKELKVGADKIDVHKPFARYGMSSLTAVTISGDLEQWLKTELSPTLLWDYPTIASLAKHLAEEHG